MLVMAIVDYLKLIHPCEKSPIIIKNNYKTIID